MCKCKYCDEEVYSKETNKMCLNCYEQMQEDIRKADIEAEHDYYNGDMAI